MKQYVKDLKPEEKVDSFFAIKFKKPLKSYAKGYMFELRVSDMTDEITAKYWGDEDQDAVQDLYDSFTTGDVVYLTGSLNQYRGAFEIAMSKVDGDVLRKANAQEYHIDDFVAKTPKDIEEMTKRLLKKVESVSDKHLRALLESFFKDKAFLDKFKFKPASMHYHQNYIGGLLEHTLNVVEFCETAAKLFPELDRDLLITGALLHDIGKIEEFNVTTSIDVTEAGMLRGHLIIGEEMVSEKLKKLMGFPEVLSNKVKHIILSHHGKNEYGSPKEPQFPEALAVYYADEFDAKVALYVKLKEEARTEDPWIWTKRTGHIYLR
jgi:3'-5' exoribonuclease